VQDIREGELERRKEINQRVDPTHLRKERSEGKKIIKGSKLRSLVGLVRLRRLKRNVRKGRLEEEEAEEGEKRLDRPASVEEREKDSHLILFMAHLSNLLKEKTSKTSAPR